MATYDAHFSVEKLIERLRHLVQLKSIPETRQDEELLRYFGGKVLISLFHAGQAGYRFSDDERRIVGPLLEMALLNLEEKLYHEIDEFPTSSYHNVCSIRSGLQYLLDDYLLFPTPDGDLQHTLTLWVPQLDLKRYDNYLWNYKPYPHQSVDDSSYHIHQTPNHHWWWRRKFTSSTFSKEEDEEDEDEDEEEVVEKKRRRMHLYPKI